MRSSEGGATTVESEKSPPAAALARLPAIPSSPLVFRPDEGEMSSSSTGRPNGVGRRGGGTFADGGAAAGRTVDGGAVEALRGATGGCVLGRAGAGVLGRDGGAGRCDSSGIAS